nr:putative dna glycosylase [Quercus suber]
MLLGELPSVTLITSVHSQNTANISWTVRVITARTCVAASRVHGIVLTFHPLETHSAYLIPRSPSDLPQLSRQQHGPTILTGNLYSHISSMARVTRAAAARMTGASKGDLATPSQLSSPPATPVLISKKRDRNLADVDEHQTELPPRKLTRRNVPVTPDAKRSGSNALGSPPVKSEKRTARSVKATEIKDEADVSDDEGKERTVLINGKPKKTPKGRSAATSYASPKKTPRKAASPASADPTPKKKKHHGVTIGRSPYPDYDRPNPEECREVCNRLEKIYGVVKVPIKAPTPSLTRAGCGNVPSVLDAMIRTKLSAATTNANADKALSGLKTLGLVPKGRLLGEGSVDYAKVMATSQQDIEDAIRQGGLAKMKSKEIKAILSKAWDETVDRKARLDAGDSEFAGMLDAEKALISAAVDQRMPCLDHYNSLSDQDALDAMTAYPGIGVKTAACVMCFCMSRPVFAVDTHVFRMCKWLGWVPESSTKGVKAVDEISTFAHCDARIPNELKYKLHQLLIKHGKRCTRCNAHVTTEKTAGWEAGCVLEDLVRRVKRGDGKVVRKPVQMEKEADGENAVERAAEAVAVETEEKLENDNEKEEEEE